MNCYFAFETGGVKLVRHGDIPIGEVDAMIAELEAIRAEARTVNVAFNRAQLCAVLNALPNETAPYSAVVDLRRALDLMLAALRSLDAPLWETSA